jgi:Tfp pilus assembly protein FimT
MLLEETRHRLGHELRQLALDLFEQLELPGGFAEALERAGELDVAGLQLGPRRLEVAGHVVDRAAELADLVGAPHARPCLEVPAADPARRSSYAGDRGEDDAAKEHHDARGDPDDREPGDHELAVARPDHFLVEGLQAEADPYDPAHLVVRLVALLAGLAVAEGPEEGQDALAVDMLDELVRLDGLHGAPEQGMVDTLARVTTEERDPPDEVGLEAGVGVDGLDGLEIGECLDAVAPVDVDPAHVPDLLAELLEEPADDVRSCLHHPVLDSGEDGGGQESSGLPVSLLEGAALAREVESEEQTESQDQHGQDEGEDLGAESLAENPLDLHTNPPLAPRALPPTREGTPAGPIGREVRRPRLGNPGIGPAYIGLRDGLGRSARGRPAPVSGFPEGPVRPGSSGVKGSGRHLGIAPCHYAAPALTWIVSGSGGLGECIVAQILSSRGKGGPGRSRHGGTAIALALPARWLMRQNVVPCRVRVAGTVRAQAGVTLTELVIVASVIILFAVSSLPFLTSFLPDLRTRGAAEQVVESLRAARQNAIGTTATYRVVFSSNQIQIICTDGTPAGNSCPANRPPDVTETVIEGATLAPTPAEMRFDPKGTTTTGNGNVLVTYPSGTTWRVEVNAPGRVRSCTGTGACP